MNILILAAGTRNKIVQYFKRAVGDSGKVIATDASELGPAIYDADKYYIVPNITEACFLAGVEYKTEYDRAYIDMLLEKMTDLGCKNVIFTGISYEEGKTGVVVYEDGNYTYYEHAKLPNSCHGTGDVYASAFVGALVRGKSAYDAAKIAADYTVECIKETAKLDNHWYGAAFEPVLGKLIEFINE